MSNSLFEQFRKPKSATVSSITTKKENLRVCICFDNVGAYVQLINDKGEIINPNYQSYSGGLRNLIRAIQQIHERNEFVIDWENPTSQLYLHQYDYL
ncbi:MAG TPA: hypothetical protein DCM71_00255, partial [Runella sp.]|nr:hypothetical protein [Runella sp.]